MLLDIGTHDELYQRQPSDSRQNRSLLCNNYPYINSMAEPNSA